MDEVAPVFAHRLDPDTNAGVGVAVTSRAGGVSRSPYGALNLGRSDADDPKAVAENFRLVREALGVSAVITVHQVHGTEVLVVDREFLSRWTPGSEVGDALGGRAQAVADAMVTDVPGVALAIRVADCVPVLLADPGARVVGVAHAGRPGLAAGVVQEVVQRMRELGAVDIVAWVGPHVCGSCYEVPAAMAADVATKVPKVLSVTRAGTAALDLGAGCEAVLSGLCVQVHRLAGCTLESEDLHSYRRDGADAGRLAGLVWLG